MTTILLAVPARLSFGVGLGCAGDGGPSNPGHLVRLEMGEFTMKKITLVALTVLSLGVGSAFAQPPAGTTPPAYGSYAFSQA